MPLYEYRCRSCGHQFEIQQSITDDALTDCPECTGALRKVFAPVGISFKGSGFYKNDARPSTGSGGSKESSTQSAGTDGSSSAGSSSDATPSKDTSSASSPSSGDSTSATTASD